MSNPYGIVADFEKALCEYTGAPYAVTTSSCTMALLLAVAWHLRNHRREEGLKIILPSRTYVSVPMSVIHAGGVPYFSERAWRGAYQLHPYPVWDCARRFFAGMYEKGAMQCVSFHASKILGDTQGGAILLDDPEAYLWLLQARFDGRMQGVAPKDQQFSVVGWHCYMSPDVAARLLLKLYSLPRHNEDLPNDEYPDLSQMEIFR